MYVYVYVWRLHVEYLGVEERVVGGEERAAEDPHVRVGALEAKEVFPFAWRQRS